MNDEKNTRTYSAREKAIIILLGAFLMGFLWRVRGTSGWGSSWGLLNAGFIFTMFVCLIKGNNKRLSILGIAVISLSFMLTTPGWGTLLTQITGVLFRADEVAQIASLAGNDVYCSVPSAIFIMLCLGFGLASIFGILLGSVYGEKKWKIKDYIILLATFFIVGAITKASVAHWILNAIQPEAVSVFEEGLLLADIKTSAFETYLNHFDDYSWSKNFIGGRNYFASIDTISLALNALMCIISTRFIIKDNYAAKTGFVVCSSFALAITVSNLFFYFCLGGYRMQGTPYIGKFIEPWNCWEYFTGFIAGGIITAFLLIKSGIMPPEKPARAIKSEKVNNIITFIAGYIFLIGISVVRPVLERFEDSSYLIPAVILAVIGAIVFVVILTKNGGINKNNNQIHDYCEFVAASLVLYECMVYLFIGTTDHLNINSISQLHNIMAVTSALVFSGVLLNTPPAKYTEVK